MRRLAVIPLLALCACGPTSGPSGVQHQPILAAQPDPDTTSVLLLDLRFSGGDAAICSSVLISPKVLLTAAHCVDPSLHASASVTVKATTKADDSNLQASDFIAVTTIARHPSWNPADTQSPYDLAALLLASAPAATPSPMLRTIPVGFVGKSLRVSGYGRTAAANTDSGTRRTAMVSVTKLDAHTFSFGVAGAAGTCSGDSGGPSFFSGADGIERVAGTHSAAASQCGAGDDIRLDAALGFIDAFVATNDPPACGADGRCVSGCATPDPDCATSCGADGICALGCATADPDCCAQDGRCDPVCYGAAVDPDCCVQDGRCDPVCHGAAVDPDCRCKADGRCDPGCTPTDPDCLCVADGTCERTCPAGKTDPDCGCLADGVCVPTCAADPDCAECGADGVCSASTCPTADPDCLLDGSGCQSASQCTGHECLNDRRGFSFCSRRCTDTVECQLDFVCTSGLCEEPPLVPMAGVKGSCSTVGARAPWLWVLLLALGRRRAGGARV